MFKRSVLYLSESVVRPINPEAARLISDISEMKGAWRRYQSTIYEIINYAKKYGEITSTHITFLKRVVRSA